MKIILFTIITGFCLVFALPAAGLDVVKLPKAGITPESPFYFFDSLAEKIRVFFVFSEEARIKILAKQALERVSEVQKMLEEKGVEAPGIQIALSNLNKNSIKVKEIVKKAKQKGKNVSLLAKEAVANFHIQKRAAKELFENVKSEFFAEKEELITRLKEAIENKDFELAEEIKAQLKEIEEAKDAAEIIKDSAIQRLEAEKKLIEADLEAKDREKAEEEREIEYLEEKSEELKDEESEERYLKEIKELEKLLEATKSEQIRLRGGEFLKGLEGEIKTIEAETQKFEKEQKELDAQLEAEEEKLDIGVEKELEF